MTKAQKDRFESIAMQHEGVFEHMKRTRKVVEFKPMTQDEFYKLGDDYKLKSIEDEISSNINDLNDSIGNIKSSEQTDNSDRDIQQWWLTNRSGR